MLVAAYNNDDIERVTMQGDYAYALGRVSYDSHGLVVIDVSNPASPQFAGSVATPGWAEDLAVAGDYAYIIAGLSGYARDAFVVIDISNPTDPQRLGSCSTRGTKVAVAGDIAYIACPLSWDVRKPSELLLVDVSDPTAPTLLTRYEPMGWDRDVALFDGGAYLAANRLYYVPDIDATPLEAIEISNWSPSLVEVAGDRAYLVLDERLVLLDITDPVSPTLLGEYNLPDRAYIQCLAAVGDYAYVVVEYDGGGSDDVQLETIDFLIPTEPLLMSRVQLGYFATNMAVAGDIAYVVHYAWYSEYYGLLRTIDVSNPDQPAILGKCCTQGGGYDVAVAGEYAYIANGERGFAVIDVSQPITPVLVGRCDLPGETRRVAVLGDIAYVSIRDGVCCVIDVSDPTSPAFIGSGDAPGSVYEMAVRGDTVYVAGGMGGLVVLRAPGVPLPPEMTPTASPTGRSTRTPTPTQTQTLTRTPKPTRTRRPTRTLRPTRTPRPTAEPTIPEPTLLPA